MCSLIFTSIFGAALIFIIKRNRIVLIRLIWLLILVMSCYLSRSSFESSYHILINSIENSICIFSACKTFMVARIVFQGTIFAEIVSASCLYSICVWKVPWITHRTTFHKSVHFIDFQPFCIAFTFLNFISIIFASPCKSELFLLQCRFVFLIQLVAGFVIWAVMNEYACVTAPAISMLKIVFAPFRIVVHPRGHFYVGGCHLGTP